MYQDFSNKKACEGKSKSRVKKRRFALLMEKMNVRQILSRKAREGDNWE